MIAKLLIVCLSLFYLSGCGGGGGSNNSKPLPPPADTELKIYGITEKSVMSRNCIYATIERSKSTVFRQYTGIQYTIDNQMRDFSAPVYFGGKDTIQLTIPITEPGPHQFVVRGILKAESGGGTDPGGRVITFNVDYQLANAGVGKYSGDRTVYDTAPSGSFSNMRVEFVTYSASKNSSNLLSGGMKFANLQGDIVQSYGNPDYTPPVMTNEKDSYATLHLTMDSSSDQIEASGPAFNHFMELLLLQGPQNAYNTQRGDLRLYRSDSASKVLSAYCSSLYHDTMEAIITLHTFDKINFFGHLRLWKKGGDKVWTYQVAAYSTDASGLSTKYPVLVLWPSIPTSPFDNFLLGQITYSDQYLSSLTNPAGAPPSQQPGSLAVVLDSDGKFKITQLSLTLDDFYNSANNSIQMKMSYKP